MTPNNYSSLRAAAAVSAILISGILAGAVSLAPSTLAAKERALSIEEALKLQTAVMDMADDYIAALGETVYLLARGSGLDSRGRWLAQSFLRNGVGASLDIAVGPNPSVNLLDLLVLASLQTWSFEKHWIPAGIQEAGAPALKRLKRAEAELWANAENILSKKQLDLVRALIQAWISENPDRTVVALVRFADFGDERRISSFSLRGKARGLLREVREVSAAVDDARLLGERLIWFAGRYPYLLGEQAELTAYRLLDQPESEQIMEAVASLRRLSEAMTERLDRIQNDLEEQQTAFFSKISTERTAAIDQFFDRLAQERNQFIDDIVSRQGQLLDVMTELNQTISLSGALARDLTDTVDAIDRVISHFDTDPQDNGEPLRMTDIRDAAIETGRASQKTTHLLEKTIELLESEAWDRRIAGLSRPADEIIDRMFWRGFILVCVLIAGLGLLRLMPHRRNPDHGNNEP